MYTIYKATNIITGKSYIGFDSSWPARKRKHKRNATVGAAGKFYDSIRKHGWQNFIWTVIYQSKDKDHCLNVMEPYFIKEYNTFNFGYNMTEGGEGCFGAVDDKIWINDGNTHKRIKKELSIPQGWCVGRIGLKRKIKMSEETKKVISQKNKGKLAKGNNPSAKNILYNGIIYSTIREAAEKNNTTEYYVKKEGKLII